MKAGEGSKRKEQAKSLYGLKFRPRSLLGSLDNADGRLPDESAFDAAVDCLPVTGYQLTGLKI